MGKLFLSPSLIAKQDICEYQIYLEKVEKQKRVMTYQMAAGLSGHRILEEDFKKDAVEVTMEKFLEEGGTTRELNIKSENHMIRGIIDELVILPDKVMIFDDKRNAKAYPSYIKQLHTYAFLVQEELVKDKPIFLAIRDLESGDVVWSGEFKSEHKEELIKSIQRIRDIIEGKTTANRTDNPKICGACSLNCQYRLARFSNS